MRNVDNTVHKLLKMNNICSWIDGWIKRNMMHKRNMNCMREENGNPYTHTQTHTHRERTQRIEKEKEEETHWNFMDLKDDQEVEANIKLIVSSGKCFGNPKRFYEFIERLSVLHFISFYFSTIPKIQFFLSITIVARRNSWIGAVVAVFAFVGIA